MIWFMIFVTFNRAKFSKEHTVLLRWLPSGNFIIGNNYDFPGLGHCRKSYSWSIISAVIIQTFFKESDVMAWKCEGKRQKKKREREKRVNQVRSTGRRSGMVAKKKNEGRELWFGVVLKSLWAWDSSRIL